MRRPLRAILEACLAGLFLCAGFASQAAAQTGTTAAANSPATQSAQPAAPDAAPASAQPAAKKVWTNDDVTGLRQDSVISTFAAPKAKPANGNAKPTNPRAKSTQWYQNRIAGLQAKLPPIDDKIAELQAALDGKTMNETRKWGGTRPDDWRVQLDGLQKQHDDIEVQISTLKDQARHDGVSPSALP